MLFLLRFLRRAPGLALSLVDSLLHRAIVRRHDPFCFVAVDLDSVNIGENERHSALMAWLCRWGTTNFGVFSGGVASVV